MEMNMEQPRPTSVEIEGARAAWTLCKRDLRSDFGEGVYRSYVDALDLAVEEDGELVFLAKNGPTQSDWLKEYAKERIQHRMNAHSRVHRPIRICVFKELSPLARDAITARSVDGASTIEVPERPPAATQWRGTFESFCEGPSNTKAVMLAKLIAARSASLRMVIFKGECGVGKTHLVEAIANASMAADCSLKVRLINGQRFSEEFIDAVSRRRDPAAFKAHVRDANLLIVDDVPRVAGRRATEEELYDTILAVAERGGFVVLTAASGLEGFGDRLAHHFKCATECEIGLPDQELRRRILDARVAFHATTQPGFSVEPDALDMIAERLSVTGRELDGAVSQLVLEWLHTCTPVTRAAAEAALRSKMVERRVTIEQIKAAVAKHHGMSVAELLRKTREKQVALPRQQAQYLSTRLTTLSLPRIAQLFGGYDHTTVLHARRTIEKYLAGEAAPKKVAEMQQTRQDIEAVLALLRSH